MQDLEPRRGRPRKFAEPSRAITLTLPEHIIAALGEVDADLSRAIVRVTERTRQGRAPSARAVSPAVALTRFGRHAVIVVMPSPALGRVKGVELVPMPDGRALIALERARNIADLELTLEDALDGAELSKTDEETFRSLLSVLREARRSKVVSLLQRSIIVLESQPKASRAPARS